MRWVLALLALFGATAANADDLRPGYLDWTETAPGAWEMTWKAPLLGGLATRARPIVPRGCTVETSRRSFAGPALVEASKLICDAPLAGREVGLSGLDQAFTDALVRIAALGEPVQTGRLTAQAPRWRVAAKPPRAQVARTYFGLGVTHILLGFDHLLFVIGLVLLIRGARQTVVTVTAFTIAHSLTLAATTLGFIGVARRPVEVSIALSIVFLAREILRPEGTPSLARRAPGLIAFVFGLLHGLGFAAALAEIGVPRGELPLALLTFNLGVEAGQLAVVAAAFAALALLARRRPAGLAPARALSAYAIGITAAYWMIERALAL